MKTSEKRVSRVKPRILKRSDRNLFYCYVEPSSKSNPSSNESSKSIRQKIYLGKTIDEAESNYESVFGVSYQSVHPSLVTREKDSESMDIKAIGKVFSGAIGMFSPSPKPKEYTVSELLEEYKKAYKRRRNAYDADIRRIEVVHRIIVKLFPNITVSQFGRKQMAEIRDYLIELEGVGRKGKYSVSYVNKLLGTIRTCFEWGKEYEYVSEDDCDRVKSLKKVRKGKTILADKGYENVYVSDEVFFAVLPFITLEIYRDIIWLLWSTAMRPSELLCIKGEDVTEGVDEDGKEVWDYEPEHHKTQHHDKERVFTFNEREIAVLKKYREADKKQYWFTSRKTYQEKKMIRAKNRQTKASPANIRAVVGDEDKRFQKTLPHIESRVLSHRLREAVKRAIKAGKIREDEGFTLYSLRGTRITKLIKDFGILVASKCCGHSNVATTDRYYNHSSADMVRSVANRR